MQLNKIVVSSDKKIGASTDLTSTTIVDGSTKSKQFGLLVISDAVTTTSSAQAALKRGVLAGCSCGGCWAVENKG